MSNSKQRNNFQGFIVFLTLVVFIASNIGFAVYTHTCSISGTDKSLFVSIEEMCGDDHPVEKKTCCSSEDEEEELIANSCCSTDTDYISLDLDVRADHFESSIVLADFSFKTIDFSAFYDALSIEKKSDIHLYYSDLPPPLYQGRTFQSIHQVYVI